MGGTNDTGNFGKSDRGPLEKWRRRQREKSEGRFDLVSDRTRNTTSVTTDDRVTQLKNKEWILGESRTERTPM